MTDGTSDNGKLIDDPSEPSMEDILASIRQLIADDDETMSASGDGLSASVNAAPVDMVESGVEVDSDLDSLLSEFSDDTLELVTPLDEEISLEDSDILSEFSMDEIPLTESSLQIPDIEVETGDLSLDDVLDEMSDGVELTVPDENPTELLSENLVDNLMGDMLSDAGINDLEVNEAVLAPGDVVELDGDGSSKSFDSDIDHLFSDIIDSNDDGGIDFDGDDADIDSILSEMSESLDIETEVVAEAETVVSSETLDVVKAVAGNSEPDDAFNIDSLLEDISGTDITEDVAEATTELPTGDSSMAEISDLMESLGDDEAMMPEMETTEFDSFGLDDILADVSPSDEILSEDVSLEDISGDPDIELVKSLMADLSSPVEDNVQTDVEPELSADVVNELASPTHDDLEIDDIDDLLDSVIAETTGDVAVSSDQEIDIIEDLLGDTIAAEEQLQETIQDDITNEISNLIDANDAETSDFEDQSEDGGLKNFADKVASDDSSNVSTIAAGAAMAGAGVSAAIVSNSNSRQTALEALLEGFDDIEDETEVSSDAAMGGIEDELSNADQSDEELIDDVLSDFIDDTILVDELATETTDVNEIGDLGTELDVPELDIIDEILADGAEEVVDTASETVHTQIETSQTETEDMAGKTARDTILDEVTETATASAFASLNQVVEEKAVVAERGDRIGDLVTEALQPMLKEWLDKNLKGIVERAVTKEVKRISSGK